jgi:hypothetical protein
MGLLLRPAVGLGRQVFFIKANDGVDGDAVADRPCILREQAVVKLVTSPPVPKSDTVAYRTALRSPLWALTLNCAHAVWWRGVG